MGQGRNHCLEWVSGLTISSCLISDLIVVQERVDREVAEHELIDRLFYFWDLSHRGALSFQVRVFLFYCG